MTMIEMPAYRRRFRLCSAGKYGFFLLDASAHYEQKKTIRFISRKPTGLQQQVASLYQAPKLKPDDGTETGLEAL